MAKIINPNGYGTPLRIKVEARQTLSVAVREATRAHGNAPRTFDSEVKSTVVAIVTLRTEWLYVAMSCQNKILKPTLHG